MFSLLSSAALALNSCSSQGKFDEADPLYRRAIEIQQTSLGPDHPNLAVSLNNRGGLLKAQVCTIAGVGELVAYGLMDVAGGWPLKFCTKPSMAKVL